MTNKKMNFKTIIIWVMALLSLISSVGLFAEGAKETKPERESYKASEPFKAYPENLDSEGFLEPKDGEKAFVYENEELGQWVYISKNLRVEIERREIKPKRGKKIVYFISDIRFKDGEIFRSYMKNNKKPKELEKPEIIARDHKLVYAQNGDLFAYRLYKKWNPGIIIRNGKIVCDKTNKKKAVDHLPLDELSLYEDGRFEMHYPNELTAEDYIKKGAIDVFAFGPILIKDGVMDERLKGRYFNDAEPRSAIGVVGKGHYKGILVEGRNKRSAGANLLFVAERLAEEGCTDAFTLDGGQTAAMVFMGKNVMYPGTYNGFTKTRRQQDVIGIGVDERIGKTGKK